jgi:hypothetical protein
MPRWAAVLVEDVVEELGPHAVLVATVGWRRNTTVAPGHETAVFDPGNHKNSWHWELEMENGLRNPMRRV